VGFFRHPCLNEGEKERGRKQLETRMRSQAAKIWPSERSASLGEGLSAAHK